MDWPDYCVLLACLIGISLYGLVKSQRTSGRTSAQAAMVGSGASSFSVALSVCSGFISSISLLGFPAEVYFQGGMILWYGPMYMLSFPIVAYLFLPVLYNLRLPTIYEYFERRFNYNCRLVATSLFCTQIILYNSVALYAPSLAIASVTQIPLLLSIIITAVLSAIYISVGGAKAGIHTSALQMALIFVALSFIVTVSLREKSLFAIIADANEGNRLILDDFRVNPTIRHSVWSLMIGGSGNILSLFAANQLSIQRYMAMKDLKSAQRVVLLNVGCNTIMLIIYVLLGMIVYSHYKGCHPIIASANELLPRFVLEEIAHIPGSVGLFAAAVYSAGISTLSASFSAVSSIAIEDVWKVYREKTGKPPADEETVLKALQIAPILISLIAIVFAVLCAQLKSIILQVAFIVFGAGGGPVLGSFVVGLFTRYVKGQAAFVGLITSIVTCFTVAIGAVVLGATPVQLPLDTTCRNSTLPSPAFDPSAYGRVKIGHLPLGLENVFAVSYQYYSVIGVVSNLLASMLAQCFLNLGARESPKTSVVNELLSPLLRQPTSDLSTSAPPGRIAEISELANA